MPRQHTVCRRRKNMLTIWPKNIKKWFFYERPYTINKNFAVTIKKIKLFNYKIFSTSK
jgi:hypothetical protein